MRASAASVAFSGWSSSSLACARVFLTGSNFPVVISQKQKPA